MQPVYVKSKVIRNIEVWDNIYSLQAEFRGTIKPGQFFMLRCWENAPLLSRPISVHDAGDGCASFLYEVRGRGTKLLKSLKEGDSIAMLGPLGNGFDVSDIHGYVALVTGGIGIAPMLYTVKSLKGEVVDLYAGFRDEVYGLESFRKYVHNIYTATDSGTTGHRGFITDIFEPSKYDVVLCCGPEAMMKKVACICIEKSVPVFLSMESRMACGIGACLTCTCKTTGGNRRVCKDGPIFDGRDVMNID